jgi:acetyl esterase/lipase
MKIAFLALLTFIPFYVVAQQEILLYPQGTSEGNFSPKEEVAYGVEWVTFVSEARMYKYQALSQNRKRTSVLICPGGGYGGIAAEKEGVEIARWFNSIGVTAFVLYYRMPFGHHQVPLNDAKLAMQIIRKNAKEWNLDKNRIGVIGFSAGGHLAATLGTHYEKDDNKPSFMALIYPVISFRKEFFPGGTCKNLLGENPTEDLINYYSNELHVTNKTPPSFIVHALNDDVVEPVHSKAFADSLKTKKVKCKLVLYNQGGHGFGMRPQNIDADYWPNELNAWLKNEKFL